MLIMLILYTYKKVFKTSSSFEIGLMLKQLAFKVKYGILILLLSSANVNDDVVNVEKISFDIIKNNSKIGYINIEKSKTNKTTEYNVDSEVNAKVIFNFNAIGREKSIYKEDTLIYSSVYRKLNKKVKINQALSFRNGSYLLNDKNKNKNLDFDIIKRNLVTLFFMEPIGIQEIYSDKFSEMLKIIPLNDGVYKIVLPNRSTNIYHYKNGKCTMVDVAGSFYKVKLVSSS